MNIKAMLRLALPLVILASLASAGPIIFDRSLVPGNLITWTPQGRYILGDDFGPFASSGTVTKISVWVIGENTATTDPSQENFSITLYAGADTGDPNTTILSKLSSTYTFANVGTFANPNLGRNQPIFRLDFGGLSFPVAGGTLYDFGVEGVTTGVPFNLASVPAGGPGQNNDAIFLAYALAAGGSLGNGPYQLLFTPTDADINVLIEGTFVPEPSTFALLGIGAGALVFFKRRRV